MNLINFADKINSPELLAYFQQFGVNEYVTAEELNEFRDSINFLANSINTNGFIIKKAHGFSGNNYVIEPLFKWLINFESFSNFAQVTLNVPFSATGKTRGELVVATTDNTFVRVVAAESSTVTAFPDLPINTIELSRYIVRDNSIDVPTVPVPTGSFVEKEERSARMLTGSGAVGIVGISTKQSRLLIATSSAVTQLSGISKIYSNMYHDGQPFSVESRQLIACTLKYNDVSAGSGSKFWFPEEKDLVVQSGQIVNFIWDVPNNLLRFVSISMTPINVDKRTGNSIKFDKIAYYGSPTVPLTGNLTLDFTNAKNGMIQDVFHQSATIPTIGTTRIIGEYQPSALNKISLEYYDNTHVYAIIKAI